MAVKPDLNEKQNLFCHEYIKDFNGKQAAIRAGYTPASAEVTASRMLSHDKVKQKIQVLMDKRAAKLDLKSDDVLREIMKLAFADISEAYDENGNIKQFKDMPEAIRKCIASVEVFEEFDGYGAEKTLIGHTKKVKFWDKTKSLELLGKHLKLFTDKIEHSGKLTLEDLVLGADALDKK